MSEFDSFCSRSASYSEERFVACDRAGETEYLRAGETPELDAELPPDLTRASLGILSSRLKSVASP